MAIDANSVIWDDAPSAPPKIVPNSYNGKTYEYIDSTMPKAAPSSKIDANSIVWDAPKNENPSLLDNIGHQLGLTARAGITGIASLPNMVGDALNGGINIGTSASNKYLGTSIPQLGMPSEATQNLMNMAGVSQPQNNTERGVQAAASAIAGVSPSVGLGKVLAGAASPTAQAIGTAMQQSPGMQMIGSAGSGGAASIAAQNGAGPIGQLAAALAGGAGALGVAGAAKSVYGKATAPNDQSRLIQALRDRENNAAPEIVKPRVKLNIDGTTTEIATPNNAPSAPQQFVPLPTAPEGGMLNAQKQLDNIDLMRRIGLEDQRPSAITGDKFQGGIEYENAKLSNPVGEVARAQINKEQSALKGFAGKIVSDTGASAQTPEAVGQSIKAPMQGLSNYFDTEVKKVYDAAEKTAGSMGKVEPKNINNLIGNNDFRESLLSSPNGTTLLGSIERQIKRFQGVPAAGEPLPQAPSTVNSAENLRKWLNSQWSPGNSKLIGDVKEALDSDVANAGGAGTFDQARALHALRRNTLDNPNGISKLLTEDGPNGINQAIPDEHVASKLLGMPTGQFQHIVDTLRNLPPELADQGKQAIAEIRAALAKKVYSAGDSGGTQNGPSVWNASNVTKELNAQKSKMQIIFHPEQLKDFETLHDAGHVLQVPMAYKGAAAQGYNYLQSGAINGLPVAGAGIGAYLGGPLGSATGAGIAGAVRGAVKSKIDTSMAEKLAEALRNPKPKFSQ